MSPLPHDKILDWMKGTDLVELDYSKDGERLGLRLAEAAEPVELPPSRLAAAASPAVGVFRSAAPGRAPLAKKGAQVAARAVLGFIENGSAKSEVAAPAAGRVAEVLVKDGEAVEYGRPLFLIEAA